MADPLPKSRRAPVALGLLLLLAAAGVAAYFMTNRFDFTPAGAGARIEVFKSARELRYYDAGGRERRFAAALGSNPVPPKKVEGDGATPEGAYFICCKNPQSKYFLSLGISYPGPRDAERGRREGLISEAEDQAIRRAAAEGGTPPWRTALGGEVFIHGRGTKTDWTQGCVALEDSDMAELYALVEIGTPVIIHP